MSLLKSQLFKNEPPSSFQTRKKTGKPSLKSSMHVFLSLAVGATMDSYQQLLLLYYQAKIFYVFLTGYRMKKMIPKRKKLVSLMQPRDKVGRKHNTGAWM